MTRLDSQTVTGDRGRSAGLRQKAVRLVCGAMEGLLLLLVCLAPWAFGAVEPPFEFVLDAGIAVLLGLWAARMLLEWRLSWQKCGVTLCLAALVLIGIWQLMPLPRSLLGRLAPGTARVYDQFLSAQPEVLPLGEERDAVIPTPGSTLSLYPTATRQESLRLLAVFLLFALVLNNVASSASLRRLSIAVVANGTLLALFALIQFFTSPHNTLYWRIPSPGLVFGPFICRNHFPFYINMCVGLGLGLLLGSGWKDRRRWNPLDLLQEPQTLWIVIALALMLSSIAFSLSRGGLLAFLGAALVCLLLKIGQRPNWSLLGAGLVILSVALALLTWFGLDMVEKRWASIWKGEALEQSRLPLWSKALALVPEFPILGSGYGTFRYVEPLRRTDPGEALMISEHAHNDYLEALVEGGILRLVISLLAIGLVYRLGYRALCRHRDEPAGALAFGALFGFTTVVLHSMGDFGLHIPAITLLATVLAAQLCALGRVESDESGAYSLRLWGLAPLAGALTAVALGLGLYSEGWRAFRVHHFRLVALLLGRQATPPGRDRQIAYLEAGARLAPTYAHLQTELGQVQLDAYREQLQTLTNRANTHAAAQTVLASAAPWLPGSPLPIGVESASSWLAASMAWGGILGDEDQLLRRRYQVPALRHFLQARDLCPLMGEPQVQIAAQVDRFKTAEPRTAYLERAKLLAPADPEVWYLCGLQEFLEQQPQRAWKSWRRSLELADRYLGEIVGLSATSLGTRDLLDQLLPDKPALLLAAASQLYPRPEASAERRPFLEKALVLLQNQPGPWKAVDLQSQAKLHWLLGQETKAVETYQAALAQDPYQADWRYELAGLLQQQGRFQEARRELLLVLKQQPRHVQARELLEAVARELATRS